MGTVAEATATRFEVDEAALMAKGRYRFRLLPAPPDTSRGSSSSSSGTGQAPARYRQRSVGGVVLHEVALLEGEEVRGREGLLPSPAAT